jgi:hypothetical protein
LFLHFGLVNILGISFWHVVVKYINVILRF